MPKLKFNILVFIKIHIFTSFHLTGTNGVVPEASQEGMLHAYKSYSDVTLFHFNVPPEVAHATWEFAAFMDSPECPIRDVHIYIQHGSYPVMCPYNCSFPENIYTGRTSLDYIVTKSAYQPHDATIYSVYNPLPGNWFVAAFLSYWDQHLQQEGLGHKCHYSLGSVALWSQVQGIPVISPGAPKRVSSFNQISYFKIFIPASTWHFSVRISHCKFHIPSYSRRQNFTKVNCIQNMGLQARALPSFNHLKVFKNLTENEEYIFTENQPYINSFYYILIVSDTRISFNIEVTLTECNFKELGITTVKDLTQMSEILGQSFSFYRTSNSTNNGDFSNTIYFSNSSEVRRLSSPIDIQSEFYFDRQNETCLPVFQLARIKHAQDFADTFLLQAEEWYTTWVALSEVFPVIVQLEILPFVDIGGTLSITIHLDELLINATYQLLTVTTCIRKGRAPSYVRQEINCDPHLYLNVSSENSHTVKALKLIPYPEPDDWFISFQAKCWYNGSIVPCLVNEITVSLDIRTQPCVFAETPCGLKGICQKTHKGLHFFTSCTCLGGYEGWGCTDSVNAIPESVLLLTTLLLTLSNIFFLPAILLAIRRSLFTEAVVYLATMVFSTFYHACDQDFYTYCVMKYEVLQFCDFFCSILAFWVTLIAIAGIPPHFASTLHIIGVLIIAIGVEYNRTGLLVFVIPFGLGVLIPILVWFVRCCRQKSWNIVSGSVFIVLLPGIILAGVGLILFAFIETEANYQYVHSTWHVVIALSLVFLLPKKFNKKSSKKVKVSNDAELFDVCDDNSSSPVFILTSDVDSLFTSQ